MDDYKVVEMVTPDNYVTYKGKEQSRAPKQYQRLKAKHPDALLLFRVGDFYETYCDDAQDCGRILGVTVLNNKSYRLAGFPYHALDVYLPKLIRAGKRVAICEE